MRTTETKNRVISFVGEIKHRMIAIIPRKIRLKEKALKFFSLFFVKTTSNLLILCFKYQPIASRKKAKSNITILINYITILFNKKYLLKKAICKNANC